jgi:copper homeostasis protein CutC
MTRIFEVCAFNIQSAIIAEKAGAARVELCDNPVEGGTYTIVWNYSGNQGENFN